MGRIILTLLCLWSCILTVTPLTETQVQKVTDYIRINFNPKEAGQYAYAVVFSEQDLLSLNGENPQILQNEDAFQIAKAVSDDNVIYTGSQMALARAKDGKNSKKKIHSEHRLLFPPTEPGVSPVQDLVNKNPPPASAIFYTLNSPCVDRCVNPGDPRNIIVELKVFDKYNNNININKAFVYNKLYRIDVSKRDEIWDGLMKINAYMDVYRCFDGKCLRCFDTLENTNPNKDFCVGKKK